MVIIRHEHYAATLLLSAAAAIDYVLRLPPDAFH